MNTHEDLTHVDLTHDLTQAYPVSPHDLQRLGRRLANRAGTAGVLDVAYRIVDSPIGSLLLAATDLGLVRVSFACENHDVVLQSLSDRISPRVLNAPVRLDTIAGELDEYFAGRRRSFDVALDWRLSAGFRRVVLNQLPNIGYGQTATYAAVAQLSGNPKAVRAVGSACATNPLPVIIPCHRVVRSDGGMGGYLAGVDVKRTLLALEGAA